MKGKRKGQQKVEELGKEQRIRAQKEGRIS
jgi:hypothetical protein